MARLSAQGSADGQVQSPARSLETASDNHDTEELTPPFFNTTFSTHRVSPLHVGPEGLTASRLESIASRLRDTLVGDVVRGIQVGLETTDTPMGQVGPLKVVKVEWFRASTLLGEESSETHLEMPRGDQSELPEEQKQGLWINIRHENAAYVAILLPGLSESPQSRSDGQHDNFVHLPLLLMRMPLQLKTVVADWLSATFDCRVSRVTLGTKTILGVWESWVESNGPNARGADFTVTLAFNTPVPAGNDPTSIDLDRTRDEAVPAPGLRSIDITISAQDLRRFLRAGQTIRPSDKSFWKGDVRERRRLAGGNTDDGWAWRTAQDTKTNPFTEALGSYLHHHLALDLFHPSVQVTQISCTGFVLGQGRLKILMLGDMTQSFSHAAWAFVAQLGERVKGEHLPPVFSAKFGG
ncbi:kinetochore complex Sim4 subunit Fta1-domain-containing protein [Fusarium solani]|uniref:Kinetochore complex Sim4 subunit Fta1-domain-containing protein n=1 Tax=Fusarium solani TaxID=169388 RepID=A0A9P9HMV5_FUSSL|nr:kinetochore complex Sim4 subunit Fta1-domain-containing protein [Fusarium solani]KAH7260554.1 kinetochore complex Sim4 subunit Fta1-domain-containing protein [Fusarium solani]